MTDRLSWLVRLRARLTEGSVSVSRCIASSLVLLLGDVGASSAEDLQLDVAPSQHVTIQGRGDSLRAMIEDLCWRAGVDLVAYDAPDRAFATEVETRPLHEVLTRLLRQESFAVGVSTSPENAKEFRVSWLRVMGEHEAAITRRAAPGEPKRVQSFVPVALVRTAFGDPEADERENALSLLAERIQSDPQQREAFLATDPRLIADTIRRHSTAVPTLTALKDQQADPSLRAKLEEVLSALRTP